MLLWFDDRRRFAHLHPPLQTFNSSTAGTQTLGEEYTDIRQYSTSISGFPVPKRIRIALVILSLFPPYVLSRWGQSSSLNENYPRLAEWLRRMPTFFNVAMEVNLAIFYVSGTYYDLPKRFLGIQHVSLLVFHSIGITIFIFSSFHCIRITHMQDLRHILSSAF